MLHSPLDAAGSVQPVTDHVRRAFFRALLCLASVLAIGRAAAAQDLMRISEPFDLRIQLRVDPSITSRVVLAELKDETENLWRPYGVQIEWTDAGAADAAAHGFSLEAILARRIERPDLPNGAAVLGRAVVGLAEPSTGPIRVSFEATETLLARRTTVGMVQDHELARALGRVLAHEIGHLLLRVPYHDETGLMRAVYRADELAAPNRAPFRLTCKGVDRLRSRIRVLNGIEHEPIDRETSRSVCTADRGGFR
jgi:hypothetical protein